MMGVRSNKADKIAYKLIVGSVDPNTQKLMPQTVDGILSELPGLKQELTNRGMPHTDEAASRILQQKINTYGLVPSRAYGFDPVNERVSKLADVDLVAGLQPLEKTTTFRPIQSPFRAELVKMSIGLDEAGKAFRADRMVLKQWLDSWLDVEGGVGLTGERALETKVGALRAGEQLNTFVEGQVRRGVVSYGLSSYGYDIRVADEFKVFTNINSTVIDPKEFDPRSFMDLNAEVCIVPPNSVSYTHLTLPTILLV